MADITVKVDNTVVYSGAYSANRTIEVPVGATLSITGNLSWYTSRTNVYGIRSPLTTIPGCSYRTYQSDSGYSLYNLSGAPSTAGTYIITTGSYIIINSTGEVNWATYTGKLTIVVVQSSDCKVNVNGTWKDGKVYANISGTWKEGTIYTNVNGVWKQGK